MSTFPERLAALEERVRNMAKDLEKISEGVDEIRSLIQQGKGAKWVIILIASIVSGVLGVIGHKWLPF
jgi:gamma-glutamyl phosphate reductase